MRFKLGLGERENFSYQHFGLSPNIITIGKSIGGGLPLGGTLFLENISQAFEKGEHGSTFAPNPVALAGARFIVENIPSLLKDVEEKGNYIMQYLKREKFRKSKRSSRQRFDDWHRVKRRGPSNEGKRSTRGSFVERTS